MNINKLKYISFSDQHGSPIESFNVQNSILRDVINTLANQDIMRIKSIYNGFSMNGYKIVEDNDSYYIRDESMIMSRDDDDINSGIGVFRAPKTGVLKFVDTDRVGSDTYHHVFSENCNESGSYYIVDFYKNAEFLCRKNLVLKSKFPPKEIYGCGAYYIIVDSQNNLELVNKKDIIQTRFRHILSARSFMLDIDAVLKSKGILSRLFSNSPKHHAVVADDSDNIYIVLLNKKSYDFVRIIISKADMTPSQITVNSSFSRLKRLDSKAAMTLEAYETTHGKAIVSGDIMSAVCDGDKLCVTSYENRVYNHYVYNVNGYNDLTEVCKFSTKYKFMFNKYIVIKYSDNVQKSVAFDIPLQSKRGCQNVCYCEVNHNGDSTILKDKLSSLSISSLILQNVIFVNNPSISVKQYDDVEVDQEDIMDSIMQDEEIASSIFESEADEEFYDNDEESDEEFDLMDDDISDSAEISSDDIEYDMEGGLDNYSDQSISFDDNVVSDTYDDHQRNQYTLSEDDIDLDSTSSMSTSDADDVVNRPDYNVEMDDLENYM